MSFERAEGIIYVCLRCGHENRSEELASLGFLHCLKCGYEVLLKKRSGAMRYVRAR